MSRERESLSGLEDKIQKNEAGISRARAYMARLGITDIAPHLKLDPSDIRQFQQRRRIVVEVNSRLIGNAIPTLENRLDDLSMELTRRIDEDLHLVRSELEAVREDVSKGLLPSLVLDRLRETSSRLVQKTGTPSYRRGTVLLAERKMQEQTVIPAKLEVEAELSEKEKQIELIKQNLGNPDAFEFPADITIKDLLKIDPETQIGHSMAHTATANSLYRAGIRLVEQVLNMSAEELLSMKGIGKRSIELVLEGLQEKGILPKDVLSVEHAAPAVEARKFSKLRADFDVQFPDGRIIKIPGEAVAETLKALVEAENNTLSSDQGGEKVYGVANSETAKNFRHNVYKLRKILAGLYEIDQLITVQEKMQGVKGIFTLRKIEVVVPEVSAPTPLFLNRTEKTLRIGESSEVNLNDVEFALVTYIYSPEHKNEEITAAVLWEVLMGAGGLGMGGNGKVIKDLEAKIGRQIIQKIGRTSGTKWGAMEQFELEVTEPTEPKLTARQRREEAMKNPVPDSRLLALTVFLDDPNIDIEEIKQVLGPDKNGKPLHYWNCIRALVNTAIFLKERFKRGLHTEQEKVIWEQFRTFIDQDPKDEISRFAEISRNWYYEQKGRVDDAGAAVVIEGEPATVTAQEEMDLTAATEASDKGMLLPLEVFDDDWDEIISVTRARETRERLKLKELVNRDPQAESRIETAVNDIISRDWGNWHISQVEAMVLENGIVDGEEVNVWDILNQAIEQGVISQRRAGTKISELDVAVLLYKIRSERDGIDISDLVEDVREIAKAKIDKYIHDKRTSRRKGGKTSGNRKNTRAYID